MRLTKLKLAGFKSFVDPTLISLPGQLVGVVGPNGCGKSNIIDAVRWVLGESKASELRGESMQDVIFNGTTERKPVSRAMVELVFDNSQGRALGQWTQYAELSVKRVLTRDGHSDYLINNIKVRRKDITDLFLGTGLGPRAYAIIGQGMIARIIEARPEELRVFLEEAAGVSKYKERRRETENRLADTRENLVRVDDIRDELNARIEHLDEQAEVARRYHALNDELTQKQHLLWFARRRDAETERRKVGVEVERTQNTLEARLADLRATEAKLEEARTAHFAAGDALHTAQADLYEANAEVARLETELRHQRQLRQSVINRVAVLETEAGKWAGQVEQSGRDEERWSELRTLAEQRVEQGVERLESRRDRLPQAEAAEAEARAEVGRLRAELARAEQALQVEQTHRTHAERALETLAARHKRLVADQQSLTPPDQAALVAAQAELEKLVEKLAQTEKDQLQAQENSDRLKVEREAAQNAFTQSERIRTELAARLAALKQVQNRAAGRGRLGDWLKKYGLENATPLWKRLDVEPGWENALESVLREKLNAVDTAGIALSGLLDEMLRNPPGGKQTLLVDGGAAQETTHVQPDTLLARLRASESGHRPLLAEWLAGIRVVASLDEGFARRDELARGEAFVCPAGHVIRRGELSFFAPDEVGHGLLEREREIETIQSELADAETALEETRRAGDEIRAASLAAEHVLGEQRQKAQSCGRERHDRQLAVLKLTQIAERFDEQSARITGQLADLEKEKNDESARLAAAEQAIDVARGKIAGLQESLSKARGVSSEAERCLREEREAVAVLERELGEARFSQRECKTKLDDIQRNRQLAQEQSERVAHELDECRIRLQDMRAEVLEPQLEAALGVRVEREEALGAARRILEEATAQVVALDESRLKNERDIEPLREKIGELKLKQQAAELNVEQMTEQLLEAGADESVLENLSGRLTPSALNNEIGRLQKEIAALGAVNLAALEELETARERAVYLDEQAADLNLAMETLENAIRRIDKETRELLQNTFDAVNRHFDELFPTLFGGGRACLVMTGEEILDAGIQVTAQPPGKKNSTIHLLSGGEKALTAIALIFSIFQLNPAPFCLLDEVDAPLDDANTVRFSNMVKKMSVYTQFLFISHNKISMEMAEQLIGVTMREQGVSRIVEVDIEDAMEMREPAIA